MRRLGLLLITLTLLLIPANAYARDKIQSKSEEYKEEFGEKIPTLKWSTSYTSNKLRWKAIPKATEYHVYRSESYSGSYRRIATTSENSYRDSVLIDSKYFYKIRASYNVDGKNIYSEYSKPVKVINQLAKVNVYAADRMKENAVGVYMKPVAGADGYYIYRSTSMDSGFEKVAVFKPKNRWCYLDENLKWNTYYYYKVCAYRTIRGKKVLSPESTVIRAEKWNESKLYELFPDGIPKTQQEMKKYLTRAHIVMVDAKGNKSYRYITVHKKVAKDIEEIFEEMAAANIPVRRTDTGSYNWRKMTTCNLMSHHSYGCVVDLNWHSNPFVRYGCDSYKAGYRPGKDPYSITQKTVEIWEKHGFTWGGDWKTYKDYMHMSYTGH